MEEEFAVIFEDEQVFLNLARMCGWEVRIRMAGRKKKAEIPPMEEYDKAVESYCEEQEELKKK